MQNGQNKVKTGRMSAAARPSGKQTARTNDGQTRQTVTKTASRQTGSVSDGRVRLSAAERSGKQPSGEKTGRQTVRHSGDKQVMRRAEPSGKATAKQNGTAKNEPPKSPKKTYDPPSSAPVHQVLPFVFLILGIFFAVCFVLYAVNLSRSEEVIGAVGRGLCRALFGVFGYGAFTIPVLLFSLALLWRKAVDNGSLGVRLGLTFLFAVVLSAFLHVVIVLHPADPLPGYDIGELYRQGAVIGGGGVVGGILGRALFSALRTVGSSILCVGALLLLAMFLCGVTPVYVWTTIRYRIRRNREKREKARATRMEITESQKLADAVLSGGLDPDPENGKRKKRADEPAGKPKTDKKKSSADGQTPSTADGNGMTDKESNEQPAVKSRRRKAFLEEDEVMPILTDESIPHDTPSDDPDDVPGLTELDMSAVYGNPAMKEALRRSDEVNGAAKESGFTATDWIRSSENTPSGEPTGTPSAESNKPSGVSRNSESAFMDLGEDTSADPVTPIPEDERIYQLFDTAEQTATASVSASAPVPVPVKPIDIPVSESRSEAEEYLPDSGEDEAPLTVPDEPAIRPYVFPPVDLLNHGDSSVKITQDEIERNMQTLRSVLKSFNINIREMSYSCGPTITRYEVRPESGTRVRQFTLLSDDIALGLAAKSGIRIEAPIPGKPAVGIEVPNDNPATVWLRSLIDTPEFASSKGILPVCLGADISGKEVFLDIVKMPHLLIAGATGMGKSVCINCLVTSLMYRYSPADVRLIMVDPKQVEFVPYKDIPHLFVPIITDPKAATAALAAAIDEMEDRFTKIKDMGVRDIRGYNDIAAMDPEVEKLPYLVIIIDELADLMMTASDEVETSICRLAQKARAAGIHLIIGTQRPSVDVVKGTIKSNIPSRIAFTVASQVDSKTILDAAGAEKLIGRGDMIYAPVGAMKPIRVQGAFVSDKEVESIADFIKKNNDPVKYDEQFMKRMTEAAARVGAKKNEGLETDGDAALQSGDDDDKLRAALEIIYDTGRASTSLLQRKLSIGYGRAAKILDALEEQGFIGPQEGSKPRTILISRQDYMERYLNDNIPSGGSSGNDGTDE